jgi:hypothetical protein
MLRKFYNGFLSQKSSASAITVYIRWQTWCFEACLLNLRNPENCCSLILFELAGFTFNINLELFHVS